MECVQVCNAFLVSDGQVWNVRKLKPYRVPHGEEDVSGDDPETVSQVTQRRQRRKEMPLDRVALWRNP